MGWRTPGLAAAAVAAPEGERERKRDLVLVEDFRCCLFAASHSHLLFSLSLLWARLHTQLLVRLLLLLLLLPLAPIHLPTPLIMALSDADVRKQLSQMIKFIMQEANEKASEISIQAEEEFNIARQNILQEEKKKINKEFERKMKQVEVKKKMYVHNTTTRDRQTDRAASLSLSSNRSKWSRLISTTLRSISNIIINIELLFEW